MKIRSAAAILALLTALTAFSSCLHVEKIDPELEGPETLPYGIDIPETDPLETDAPETGAPGGEIIPVNFTLENLREENLISNILRWNESVTVRREYDGGSETTSLWLRGGDRVCYDVSVYNDGEQAYNSVAGSYRGMDFMVQEGEPVTAMRWVTAQAQTFEDWAETLITDYLPASLSEDIAILSEDAENYTVLLKEMLESEEQGSIPCDNTVVINKGTLAVQSLSWEYTLEDTVYYGAFTVEYNREKLGEEVMSAWDSTGVVTVDVLTETGGKREESFEFPKDWALRLLPDEDIYLTTADGLEEDGTILFAPGVTPAAETVTVFARDEANAAVPESPDNPDNPDSPVSPDIPDNPEPGEMPFTLEKLTEANRVTNLLNKYGTLTMKTEAEYGTYTICFFRHGEGGSIVRYSETNFDDGAGNSYYAASGMLFGDYFDRDAEGGIVYYASVPDTGEYLFVDQNADGEHYDYDLTLSESLLLGSIEDVTLTGGTVTFRCAFEFDETGESDEIYTADAESAEIRSVRSGIGTDSSILYGENVPFAAEFEEAFKKTRSIICHFEGVGDFTYTLPANWAFNVGWFEDLPCYSDAGMKEQRDSRIPGDGQDYEIWIRVAMG